MPPALCREADRRCELNGTPCTSWSCALHAYNYCDYCDHLGDRGADRGDYGDHCDDGGYDRYIKDDYKLHAKAGTRRPGDCFDRGNVVDVDDDEEDGSDVDYETSPILQNDDDGEKNV